MSCGLVRNIREASYTVLVGVSRCRLRMYSAHGLDMLPHAAVVIGATIKKMAWYRARSERVKVAPPLGAGVYSPGLLEI